MRRHLFALVALSCTLVGSANAQLDALRDFVTTPRRGVGLLAAETVVGGTVQSLTWSPDSRYLLVNRMAWPVTQGNITTALIGGVPQTAELHVWDRRAKRTQRLFAPPATAPIQTAGWMSGRAMVYVVQMTERAGKPVSMLSFHSTSTRPLVVLEETEAMIDVTPSPTEPVVAVQVYVEGKVRSLLISPGGAVSPLPHPVGPEHQFQILADSRTFVGYARIRVGNGLQVRRFRWQGGDWKEIAPTDDSTNRPELDIELVPGRSISALNPQTQAPTESLWIASKPTDPRKPATALVSGDALLGQLSPDGRAVAYVSRGAALVREMVEIDLKTLDALLAMAAQTKAMNDAKQAALALIMNAADEDDVYMNPKDYPGRAEPYIKDRSILGNFVYTFGGGSAIDLKDPSKTELGYVETPTGRAVAYADGHVKWHPKT